MSTSELQLVESPIIQETRLEIEKAERLKSGIIDRRIARMEFWMDTMNCDDHKMTDRLRASELSAKADCDFIDKREVNVTATYREMLMTRAGKLEELEPPHKVAMLEADLANELEDMEELEYSID